MNELLLALFRMDRVIPVAVEAVGGEMNLRHLLARDLLAFRILPFVEFASDPEAPFGSCRGD